MAAEFGCRPADAGEESVAAMAAQGLTFAPAVPADAASYVALHRALVAYEAALKGRGAAER